jgi:hypothetical protein
MGGLGILGGFSGEEVWKLVAGRVQLGCVAASWCSPDRFHREDYLGRTDEANLREFELSRNQHRR